MGDVAASVRDGRPLSGPAVAMVAGETSGDMLAALLLAGLRTRWPSLHSAGIGGPRMSEQGFDAWWPSDKLAVRGYVEVLRHYREITGIRSLLKERLLRQRPDVFIGIDAPDFNLQLESDLKARGIRTVQFVCPSVWAWRADRIGRIRESADHVLCLFPFEPALLQQHGIAATYVGHPLADVIPLEVDRDAARAALGLSLEDPVLAVLPGSRRSEIQYLARRFLDATAILLRQRPRLQCILPALPALRPMLEAAVRAAGLAERVRILSGQSHAALAACDVTLIASGTATLEAALFKRPMVVGYNMHWLSWQIMRRKRLQPWVALPNILCQDFVVPEFLQEGATPVVLANAVSLWLDQPEQGKALRERFQALHRQLRCDTSVRATDAIEQLLAL